MKQFRNISIGLVVVFTVVIIAICTYYNINMGAVSSDDTLREVTIEEGTIESIGITLKNNNLIF